MHEEAGGVPQAAQTAQAQQDPEQFLKQCEKLIPAEFVMISGCEDAQTSMDVGNAASGLPNNRSGD